MFGTRAATITCGQQEAVRIAFDGGERQFFATSIDDILTSASAMLRCLVHIAIGLTWTPSAPERTIRAHAQRVGVWRLSSAPSSDGMPHGRFEDGASY